MKKIGIIGLGDIARKAYLPVVARLDVDLHLYSRNPDQCKAIAEEFRINNTHNSIASLISSGIEAAFLHTNTASHFEIARQLLENRVHVFVDKPISSVFHEVRTLAEIAARERRVLFCGFNRRYAPAYQALRDANVNMLIMQKNRTNLPGNIRTFVFDDFIHVVDTLLHLLPELVASMNVVGNQKEKLLSSVVIQFITVSGKIGIGIMNRETGVVEETLEVFTPLRKTRVRNLSTSSVFENQQEIRSDTFDWQSNLYARGFPQMIDHFLKTIDDPSLLSQFHDAVDTHRICEEIIETLEERS